MDKYVRIKQIGEGSFGKALLVKRKEDGKMCVIKEIGISKMSRKEQEDSKKEVKVLSQLKHPNIVSYQESFEGNGNLYIVMDYCEGGDLHQYIKNQRGVPIEENKVLDIFIQCCLAIKYVHDRKILHRDIKTQNIFLTKDNCVKLGDFGIARVLKSTVELAHTCIGTPYYLSPEIVENRPYNNKSDVWSLGCVLYEMVTLKHAFEAGNMKNLVMKIVRGSYPPISNRYSFEIRALVAETFKRSPSYRPSISTILKKSFIQKRLDKFVPSSELANEGPSDAPVNKQKQKPVIQAPVSVVEPTKKAAVKRRDDIANIYGASLAKKPNRKPTNVMNPALKQIKPKKKIIQRNLKSSDENNKEVAARERRRQNLIEADRKHMEQMKKMQRERWQNQNLDQMKMARGEGWRNILGAPEQSAHQQVIPAQAVKELSPCKEEKPNMEIAKLVKDPVDQKPIAQQMKPQINVVEGNLNGERAKLLEDYWQRKREADVNKMRANQDIYGKVNWKPPPRPINRPGAGDIITKKPPAYASARNKQEQEYLQQLEAIRHHNFVERRGMNRGHYANPINQCDPKFDPQARKKKIQDLKEQAAERGALLVQKCKNPEKQPLPKQLHKMPNENQSDRVWDERPLPAQNRVRKEEMVIPSVGIETALREVQPKLHRSCSEGDLQEAIKNVDRDLRKNWPVSNVNSIGLGNLPMEITASAMEATYAIEDDRKSGTKDPVVFHKEKRKLWIHDGKTQFVADLCNKEISGTQAPTKNFEEQVTCNDQSKTITTTSEHSNMDNPIQKGCIEIERPGQIIHTESFDSNKELQGDDSSPFESNNTVILPKKSDKLLSSETVVLSENTNNKTVTYESKSPAVDDKVTGYIAYDLSRCSNNETYTLSAKSANVCTSNIIKTDLKSDQNNQEEGLKDENIGSVSISLTDQTGTSINGNSSSTLLETMNKEKSSSLAIENTGIEDIPTVSCTDLRSEEIESSEISYSHNTDVHSVECCEDVVTNNVELPSQGRLPPFKEPVEAWAENTILEVQQNSLHIGELSPESNDLQEDTDEEFLTPNRTLGLQSGVYDTATKLLRTCSLPELNTLPLVQNLYPYDCDNDIDNNEDVDDDCPNDTDENIPSIHVKPELPCQTESGVVSDAKEEVLKEVQSSMNLEDLDNDEEVDDYASMIESMSDLLSNIDEDTANDGSDTNEDSGDWESDEDENEVCVKTLREKDRESKEDLFSRNEESRKMLEDELGLDLFMKVYRHLQTIQDDENDELELGTMELSNLMGEKQYLYQKVLYLVLADAAYCEGNDGLE